MKRTVALIISVLLLVAAVPLTVSCAAARAEERSRQTAPDGSTDSLSRESKTSEDTAGAETIRLCNTVLDKLITEKCSFAGYRGATYAEEYLSYVYFVPELKELEKADDACLALIELYEAQIPVLKEKYASVLAHAYEMSQNDPEHFALTAEESQVYRTYRNIEALLSIEVYASKLTDEQKLRFEADREIIKAIVEEAQSVVYGA